MRDPRGWHSRGYLPHIDVDGLTQFVTWRTADSIPQAVLDSWRVELSKAKDDERWRELARRTEHYCDQGHGECPMRDPRAARGLQECLLHDHGTQYELHAWVVMPNHVHVLLCPREGVSLSTIMHRLKTASAHAVNRAVGRKGSLWQIEYFDRYVRSGDHFAGAKRYTEWNPVKAKLCTDPKKYPWSSASPDAQARLEFLMQQREMAIND